MTVIPKPGKDSKYDDMSSWRSIVMLLTSYKVFASILVGMQRSTSRWPKDGFKHKGFVEQNAITDCCKRTFQVFQIFSIIHAWLDIKEAFPSIPHKYTWSLLRYSVVDDNFVKTNSS